MRTIIIEPDDDVGAEPDDMGAGINTGNSTPVEVKEEPVYSCFPEECIPRDPVTFHLGPLFSASEQEALFGLLEFVSMRELPLSDKQVQAVFNAGHQKTLIEFCKAYWIISKEKSDAIDKLTMLWPAVTEEHLKINLKRLQIPGALTDAERKDANACIDELEKHAWSSLYDADNRPCYLKKNPAISVIIPLLTQYVSDNRVTLKRMSVFVISVDAIVVFIFTLLQVLRDRYTSLTAISNALYTALTASFVPPYFGSYSGSSSDDSNSAASSAGSVVWIACENIAATCAQFASFCFSPQIILYNNANDIYIEGRDYKCQHMAFSNAYNNSVVYFAALFGICVFMTVALVLRYLEPYYLKNDQNNTSINRKITSDEYLLFKLLGSIPSDNDALPQKNTTDKSFFARMRDKCRFFKWNETPKTSPHEVPLIVDGSINPNYGT